MKTAVIIPAAGTGTRFSETSGLANQKVNKIEFDVAGKPLFLHVVELFLKRGEVSQIILAVNPDRLESFKFRWGDKLAFHDVALVAGGTTERWETVRKALDHVGDDCTHAAVHDAARPLASRSLIDRLFEASGHYSAVIPGLPVGNTLKLVASKQTQEQDDTDPLDAILGPASEAQVPVRRVIETVDRANLYEVQTPQIFELSLLRRAYAELNEQMPCKVTDDAQLVEAIGEPVYIIEGDPTNLKVTHAADIQLVELFLHARQQHEAASLGRQRLFGDDDDD